MFILADKLFYEPFESRHQPTREYIELVTELSQHSRCPWQITHEGLWVHVHPCDPPKSVDEPPRSRPLPYQGWKLHVSATITNDLSVLRKAAIVAIAQEVSFKFVPDRNVLSLMSSKAWPRARSGKFMTFYPTDLDVFKSLSEALYVELRGEDGPYILSDKRYKDCRALFYRYGGIAPNRRLEFTGIETPILVTPDGESIPDVRTPYFAPPPWAHDPFPSEEESESDITLGGGRYAIKNALTFSNSGGVYLAEDRETGKDVIIKEARANTLIDGRGNDAIILLKREHTILKALKDTGFAPEPIESFYAWENFFLVEEFIEGTVPREIMLTQSPLMKAAPSLEDSQQYFETFRILFRSFAERLHMFHERGIVFGDLSHTNLKVDETSLAVRFFDFEGAYRTGVDNPTFIYTPGFKSESSVQEEATGISEDLYSLAAIMLYMIFPISAVASLRDDVFDDILRTVLADVGWHKTRVFDIIRGLSQNEITCADACELLDEVVDIVPPRYSDDLKLDACREISQKLGSFLLAHMRETSDEGLFPADPFMHRTNPLNWGFGACGVLYSLKKCGSFIPQHAYDWLERQLERTKPEELAPGLLTGASGIAWCLWELGLEDRAVEMMKMANESDLLRHHHSYYYGMAGVGMANLFFFLRTQKDGYIGVARGLAETLLRAARESDLGLYWENSELTHLGFGYGQSGVALFFLRLFELTGEERFLAQGRRALEFDLAHGIESEHGGLSFPSTPTETTLLPYLEEGSAGIAKTAIRYDLWDLIEPIWPSVHRKYSGFPGLLYGLGSFADVLTDAFVFSGEERFLEMAKRPLAGLRDIYLIEHPSGLATPGDSLFRVSCDYATGVAGILRTFYRIGHLDGADFFLDEVAPVAGRRVAAVPASDEQGQEVVDVGVGSESH